MNKPFNCPLLAILVIIITLGCNFDAYCKGKNMTAVALREVPVSVSYWAQKLNSDKKECPIVDVISNIDVSIKSYLDIDSVRHDSVPLQVISKGKNEGHKRVFFENIPLTVLFNAVGYEPYEVSLSYLNDTIPNIEFGKQYELLLMGEPRKNFNDVTITVNPMGLKMISVKIDGEYMYIDKDQVVKTRLRYGKHSYSVSARDYKTAKGEFWVTSRNPVNIAVELSSLKSLEVSQDSKVTGTPDGLFDVNKVPSDYIVSDDANSVNPKGKGDIINGKDTANKDKEVKANPPFTPEEKLFYGPDSIGKWIAKNTDTPNHSTSGGNEKSPKEGDAGVIFVDAYKPKDFPFIVTSEVSDIVEISRIRDLGVRYSGVYERYMNRLSFTMTRRKNDFWAETVEVYVVDMDYKLYCLGDFSIYIPSKIGESKNIEVFVDHYAPYYGQVDKGASDYYRRTTGGKYRYWGSLEKDQYDIPKNIRGLFVARGDIDTKNMLHLIKPYLSKKTMIW